MTKLQMIAAALFGLALAVPTAAAAKSLQMPVRGATSQPVGHYEFCEHYASECGVNREVGVVRLTNATWKQIVQVNNTVNTSIYPETDQEIWGRPEVWSYPTTVGDCEDFALLKQYMLEQAGFPRSALLITVVLQPNGDGHAVLTVSTDKGDFILDNLEDRVLNWSDTDYRYLKRQSDRNSAKWVSIADDRDILVGSVR
ncbi:transglutaminase-like cysteine peptidase [Mangrovibrevibacter kandeliae]|uniref:transglutaminase-like cysteine peptidase n=1 Tax=Mangrovibrevibacter kandeliae TaxID=2968473 RepID=UPI002117F0F1|nr:MULTISPECIES: transglutaminase-like cysteine peptidase [unclassified Aurantimonas]MCQ8782704.1 transglutaminase-like cysteine peptidase [Aurantimonas sp. CSK15Z-1]MCW4114488.1 transglutaminase-like cysteine peptidase [Aurantimonas sp. MSK8Z-1]